MTTSRLLLDLLAMQAFTLLLTGTITAVTVIVTAHQALRDTQPQQRAAILRSIAEITRALHRRGK
ncbi:hypothetical protein QMK19_34315 [Streptomyces sp. H10-C2]|uniref:hypothetical protein n=1 Tax=unclassified Streptomyces TaxID=2593676 RepID=UPI0024BA2857|nr:MULTISPECIES: hypothetical protein [unclassified Streptomyces]MDJ0345711.1 hypothetical protein [Streptomyces sp. PH10-H1]MDJ0374563.1 hypothetical protein [Streptomyces sp. H10-C2]